MSENKPYVGIRTHYPICRFVAFYKGSIKEKIEPNVHFLTK